MGRPSLHSEQPTENAPGTHSSLLPALVAVKWQEPSGTEGGGWPSSAQKPAWVAREFSQVAPHGPSKLLRLSGTGSALERCGTFAMHTADNLGNRRASGLAEFKMTSLQASEKAKKEPRTPVQPMLHSPPPRPPNLPLSWLALRSFHPLPAHSGQWSSVSL